jgi:hypothetical protein
METSKIWLDCIRPVPYLWTCFIRQENSVRHAVMVLNNVDSARCAEARLGDSGLAIPLHDTSEQHSAHQYIRSRSFIVTTRQLRDGSTVGENERDPL